MDDKNVVKIDDFVMESKLQYFYADEVVTNSLNSIYSKLFESKDINILRYLDINGYILLYGKTGMGKTSTAYNFMKSHNNCTKYQINTNSLISEKLGKTPKQAEDFFEALQMESKKYPTIGLIEEVDTIFMKREESNELADMKRFLAVFLKYLDTNIDNLMLICTTNHIENIDSSILRRFCFKFQIKQNELLLKKFLTSKESPFCENFQDDSSMNELIRLLVEKNTSFSEIKYLMRELYLNNNEINPINIINLIVCKGE